MQQRTLVKIIPVDAGHGLFYIVPIDPDLGIGGGPILPPEGPPSVWPGPNPSHPIMLPGMPGWGSGGPVDPGYGVPGPGPGPQPPSPGPGTPATVIPLPPSDTPPPAGIAPGSTQMLIWFGPGTKPAVAWVAPYVSTGPVPDQPQVNPLSAGGVSPYQK